MPPLLASARRLPPLVAHPAQGMSRLERPGA